MWVEHSNHASLHASFVLGEVCKAWVCLEEHACAYLCSCSAATSAKGTNASLARLDRAADALLQVCMYETYSIPS